MDKKQLHYLWTKKIRPIKIWYLLLFCIISMTISVFALRDNNLKMVQLRQGVYTADENNSDVEGALQKLRVFVYGHMNTKLSSGGNAVYPPIQLKYTYQRLQDAEKQKSQAASAEVYTQAQQYCESQNSSDFSGRNRVPCIEKYVSEHNVKVKTIPDAMYKFDFVSPSWSPDFAGYSVAISVLSLIALVVRIGAGVFLGKLLK